MSSAWTFFTVDLELTNRCAVGCRICPREAVTRPRGVMTAATLDAVARALAGVCGQVTLSGMGDPTQHPDWAEAIARLRKAKIPVGIQLSAAVLDAETRRTLVAAAPSFVNVSVPSLRRELVPDTPPAALVSRTLALAEARPVTVIGTHTPGDDPPAAFTRFWRQRGIPSRVSPAHSRGGHLVDPALVDPARPIGGEGPCGLFARHAFVTWQGDVLACCHDLTGDSSLGNLVKEGLAPVMTRKAKMTPAPPFALCARCDEPLRRLPLPTGDPPTSREARARYFRSLRTR